MRIKQNPVLNPLIVKLKLHRAMLKSAKNTTAELLKNNDVIRQQIKQLRDEIV